MIQVNEVSDKEELLSAEEYGEVFKRGGTNMAPTFPPL